MLQTPRGESSIKTAYFSFYCLLAFWGRMWFFSNLKMPRESQFSYIHSLIPLGATLANPPKKSRLRKGFPLLCRYYRNQKFLQCFSKVSLSLPLYHMGSFSPVPRQGNRFPNIWRGIGDLKFTNCLKHVSKLQELFLTIITVLWRQCYSLHFSSEWAAEGLEICLSPNMKWSRSIWCHISINCISLLIPYKIP